MSPNRVARHVAFFLAIAVAVPCLAQAKDSIKVARVEPAGRLHRGVPIEVVLTVDVTLASSDSAYLAAGFNSDDPKKFRMLQSVLIRRGAQRVTLRGRVVPTDWSSENGVFGYVVNIRPPLPPPPGGRGRGLANVRGTFVVVP